MKFVVCVKKPTHNSKLSENKKYKVEKVFEDRNKKYIKIVNDVNSPTWYEYHNSKFKKVSEYRKGRISKIINGKRSRNIKG